MSPRSVGIWIHMCAPSSRLAALLVASSLLGATVALGENASGAPDPGDLPDPTMAPPVETERAAEAAAQERAYRASDAGRQERSESREAFRDQSQSEALTTARAQFPEFVDAPPLKWPPLMAHQELHGYVGDHAAVIDEPLGKRGVIESSIPLRGETPDRDPAPIDLALVDVGTVSYAPRSAAAQVRIPRDAQDELRFPEQSFGVSLEGANSRPAAINSNKAFFANVATDADLILEPRPLGAEVSVLLRSPAAPSSIPLRFSLADGQRLRLAESDDLPAGSAEIVGTGGRVAAIGAALAIDAQGRSLPVHYRADGERLVMDVDTSGEVAWPVYADPPIGVYDNNGTSAGSGNASGWTWRNWTRSTSSNTTPATTSSACNSGQATYFYFCQGTLDGGYATGGPLYVKAHPWGDFSTAHWAQWLKPARADSYIYQLHTTAVSQHALRSELYAGVWAWTEGWQPGRVIDADGDQIASLAYYTDRDDTVPATMYFKVHNGRPIDAVNPHPTGNIAAFGIRMMGGAPLNAWPYVALGGAATISSETFAPTLNTATHTNTPPSGWVQSYTDTVSVSAHDRGLGMGTITATGPGLSASQSACTQNGAPPNNDGAAASNLYDACGLDLNLAGKTYTAPEGISTYTATATDLVGNRASSEDQTWQVKVDRTGPTVTASDSLWNLRGQALAPGRYNLHIVAADGATNASVVSARSGLAKIDVIVDGDLEQTYLQPTCSPTGCGGSTDYVFETEDWPAEQHAVQIVATDSLGNTTTQSFTVSVAGEAGEVPAEDGGVLTPAEAVPDTPTAPRDLPPLSPDPAAVDHGHAAAETDVLVDDPMDPVTESSSATDLTPAVSASRTTVSGNPNRAGLEANGRSSSDSTGGVSPHKYIQMVNTRIRLYDRAISALATMTLPDFAGSPNADVVDPQIMWDAETQRWYYLALRTSGSTGYLAFGWSRGANPSSLGADDWCKFFRSTGANIDDYPKLGDSKKHLVLGTNVFRSSDHVFLTSRIWAVPKPLADDTSCSRPRMFSWGSATNPLRTRDGTWVFTPVPAQTHAAGNVGYIAAADYEPSTDHPDDVGTQIQTWHISGARGRPRLTRDANVNVARYRIPPLVSQPNSTHRIDSHDTRLTQAVAMRDPGAGQLALWTQHTIRAPTGRARVRWYELLPRSSSPRRQQGHIADPAHSVFNGAVSPNGNGGAVIQYNVGSRTLRPQIRARSRLRGTDLNRMTDEVTLASSNFHDQDYTCDDVDELRGMPACAWGDYAAAVPDPSSASSVWGTNTILGRLPLLNDANWTTQIFKLSAVP